MEKFTYFNATLTNQNCMHIKIKWIKFMECFLPFPCPILHFLSQDFKIKLHESIILSFVRSKYGRKKWLRGV